MEQKEMIKKKKERDENAYELLAMIFWYEIKERKTNCGMLFGLFFPSRRVGKKKLEIL